MAGVQDDVRARWRQAQAQAEGAQARALQLEAAIAASTTAEARARAELGSLAARVQAREAAIGAAQLRLAVLDGVSRQRAGALAQARQPALAVASGLLHAARQPPLASLTSSRSFTDLAHQSVVTRSVARTIKARTAQLAQIASAAQTARRDAAATQRRLQADRNALVDERTRLAALIDTQRASRGALAQTLLAEQDRALALAEQTQTLQQLVARVDATAARTAALARLPGPTLRPGTPTTAAELPPASTRDDGVNRKPYRLPVAGTLTAGLGERDGGAGRTRGLVFATAPGALVLAPSDGRVAFAGPFMAYGPVVIIDHGEGWTTLLTGLGRIGVRVGERLGQGDPVGQMPDGGDTRLTVELRRAGQVVDISALVG